MRPTIVFPMILVLILPSTAVLDPGDYLALQSIRSSLRDLPGSAFFSSWDFTSDPCSSFSGLLCSAGRVVSLSLGDPRAGSPGLSGRLPSSLGRLSALTDLSLVPGRVYGPIPPSLSRCSALRFLALSQNYLSGPIPPSLSSLRFLQTLDLSFNLLTGPVPAFSHSPLANLILCHNRLSGGIPATLASCASLVRLDLKRNSLTGPLPSLPPSLKYLALSYNNFYGPIDRRTAGNLHSLNHLDLSANRFAGSIPGIIFTFPIITLYLQRNLFSGPVRAPAPVTARVVDLSYNRLTGEIPAGVASAERIYLNSNRFVGSVPERFVERVRGGGIRVLYLQHNYLSGMGVDGLVPASVSLCLNFNCMVPPPGNVCPVRSGRWKRRPAAECRRWTEEGRDGMN